MVVPRWQLSSLNTRSSPFTCISSGVGDASLKACCRTGVVGSAAHPCAATRYHAVINLDRPAACGRGDSGDLDLFGCRCARRSLPSRIRLLSRIANVERTRAQKVTLLGTLSWKPRAPCHCWRTRGCHSPHAPRPDVLRIRRSCHAANLALVAWRPVDQTE